MHGIEVGATKFGETINLSSNSNLFTFDAKIADFILN